MREFKFWHTPSQALCKLATITGKQVQPAGPPTPHTGAGPPSGWHFSEVRTARTMIFKPRLAVHKTHMYTHMLLAVTLAKKLLL